jgi:hypothetical protein
VVILPISLPTFTTNYQPFSPPTSYPQGAPIPFYDDLTLYYKALEEERRLNISMVSLSLALRMTFFN